MRRTFWFSLIAGLLLGTPAALGASRPDLRVTSLLDPPEVIAPGAAFSTEVHIRNSGGSLARRTRTRVFLSPGGSGADVPLASYGAPPLRPRGTSVKRLRFDVPADATPTVYYLVVCLDADKRVRERDERNCAASDFSVTLRPYSN